MGEDTVIRIFRTHLQNNRYHHGRSSRIKRSYRGS